ncbi:rhomboid family intramembrane serine protease [Haloferula sp.]|uniref:rhomboid family intramembrane serine protease n=1 Tax=Haloferula sp. TaxID=2497595 RepID=UPI00329B5C4E
MPRESAFNLLWREQGPLLVLIGVICVAFYVQNSNQLASIDFMVVPEHVATAWDSLLAGDFDLKAFVPLLSYAFLHGGIDHLLSNMLFLWIFAALAAELIGYRWMLLTFVITAICGGVWHVVMNADGEIPMLGASGAVMGFEGLYLGMVTRWHLPNPHIWPMARPIPPAQLALIGIMGLVMDYMGFMGGSLGVAYSAHLGGFIGGLVLGALVVPMPQRAQPR